MHTVCSSPTAPHLPQPSGALQSLGVKKHLLPSLPSKPIYDRPFSGESLPFLVLAIRIVKLRGWRDPREYGPHSASVSHCVFLDRRQRSPIWLMSSRAQASPGNPHPSKKGAT